MSSSSSRRSKGDDTYYSRSSRHRRSRSRSKSKSKEEDVSYHSRRDGLSHRAHDSEKKYGKSRKSRSRSRSRDRDGNRHKKSDQSSSSSTTTKTNSSSSSRSRHEPRSSSSSDRSRSSRRQDGEAENKGTNESDSPLNQPEGSGISIKLCPATLLMIATKPITTIVPNSSSSRTIIGKPTQVASIFNDDDDEPEEMPAECKMRMKNIGRDTPTSAGPNSFGKTKIGFCNALHIAEKELEDKQLANKKK